MLTRRAFVASSCHASAMALAAGAVAQSVPAESKPLRIAQIGLQGHWDQVAPRIPSVPNCRLVAAARSMPGEKIEVLTRQPAWSSESRLFDDYRKMLDEVKPDVVAIFMPYGLNGQANLEALRRGCHIISEKPIANSIDELDTLRREWARAGAKYTTLLPTRLEPAMVAARKAVADGLIGEPVLVSAQKTYRWGENRPEYYKRRSTYGGSIPWVAIHAIDFMRYVSGVDFAEVSARQAVKVHQDYPECEDCGALLFELANGGQGSLTFDFLRPTKAPSHGDDRVRVVGSKGVVEVRLAAESFCELITETESARKLPTPPIQETLFGQFIAHIRGGPVPIVTAEDAFRATEIALKARDAADTRCAIRLDGRRLSPEAVAAEQVRQTELHKHDIYNEKADAKAEIAAACEHAGKAGKHVLLMYGGNWCGWCHRLNYLLQADLQLSKALSDYYELLHVDINSNKRLASLYQVEEDKGVPYFTVLRPDNKVIHNQETSQFEMGGKGYDISKVLAFLIDYRPGGPATRPASAPAT